jgi:uncharacterized protein (UPF0332 family)
MELEVEKLLKKGVIARVKIDHDLINELMASAESLLVEEEAEVMAEPVRSFTRSYDAVFAACSAFILAFGYRLTVEPDHRSLLQFCELTIDDESAGILRQFQAVEIRRHHEMYTGCYSIDETEAAALLGRACLLVRRLKPAT